MARDITDKNFSKTLEAAENWKVRCFVADGSIFSDGTLWTSENFGQLKKAFVDNPDMGDRSFYEKLQDQLKGYSPDIAKLAAEIVWLLLLFCSGITPKTKRTHVALIWSWSGSELPVDDPAVSDGVFMGVGRPGTAYITQIWREFEFVVRLMVAFKALAQSERGEKLADPWAFQEWQSSVERAGERQFRHILNFFCFPDSFERIATSKHKKLVVATFSKLSPAELDQFSDGDLDKQLLEIRNRLRTERGIENFDFYLPGIRAEWLVETANSWLLSWNPSKWEWKEFQEDRRKAALGEPVIEEWRCANSAAKPGDPFYLVRAGSEPRGIIAAGTVLSSPFKARSVDPSKGGAFVNMIKVQFEEIRDPSHEAYVPLSELEKMGAKQVWNPQQSGIAINPSAATKLKKLWCKLRPLDGGGRTIDTTGTGTENKAEGEMLPIPIAPYTVAQATAGLFMGEAEFTRILNRLRSKKNVILQGAPGVGKSFLARRLAFALMEEKDHNRIAMVQFHQSYSYEDFVHGYRPKQGGSFELKYGPFYRFCEEARRHPQKAFVFIIDEINRGNLSKVLGELMMLIEVDKRSSEWALPLAYSSPDEEPFYVPANVHLLGMMNTADRSLAVVDYALRRRFSFVTLPPCFAAAGFRGSLRERGVSERLTDHIISGMTRLNQTIAEDQTNLGLGFCIGHSYFTPIEDVQSEADWYASIVDSEIAPLLKEYYFDNHEKADSLVELLAY